MRKKILAYLLTGILSAACLTGCFVRESPAQLPAGQTETTVSVEDTDITAPEEDIKDTETEETAAETEVQTSSLPTKDRSGNDITVPENVEKIVSMAPSVTEILIDLGYADKIIACDTYTGYSALAASLTEGIPQFDMMQPDNEAIIALEPDIVITTGMSYAHGDDVYAAVKSSGVCVADIPSSASIDDMKKDIEFIGEIVGASDKASEITAKMDAFSEEVKKVASGIDEKKTVLYVMSVPSADYPDVYTCGKGTYMDEIFTLVGTVNVAGDIEAQWPSLSEEAIISSNPDVIIIGDTYTPDPVDAILNKAEWKDINAIKNKEVYAIDGDAFNQPNHYVMNSAYEIAEAVYPDLYKDIEKPFN